MGILLPAPFVNLVGLTACCYHHFNDVFIPGRTDDSIKKDLPSQHGRALMIGTLFLWLFPSQKWARGGSASFEQKVGCHSSNFIDDSNWSNNMGLIVEGYACPSSLYCSRRPDFCGMGLPVTYLAKVHSFIVAPATTRDFAVSDLVVALTVWAEDGLPPSLPFRSSQCFTLTLILNLRGRPWSSGSELSLSGISVQELFRECLHKVIIFVS